MVKINRNNNGEFGENFRGDKKWFADNFGDHYEPGRFATCHTCGHEHAMYRRTLNAGMTRRLIAMYRANGRYWQVIESNAVREESKLAWWRLLYPDRSTRGKWRVTERGELWLQGRITVPKWAVVLDNQLLSLEGKRITVSDALKEPFDFDKLMRGE